MFVLDDLVLFVVIGEFGFGFTVRGWEFDCLCFDVWWCCLL